MKSETHLRCRLVRQSLGCLQQITAALLRQHLSNLRGGVRGQAWGWAIQVQPHVTQDFIITMDLERRAAAAGPVSKP